MTNALHYFSGFGGHFESEAVPGALPKGRNSPQRPAFGLYTEQLSGSSFTAPRHENRRCGCIGCARPPTTARSSPIRARHCSRRARSMQPLAPNRLRWDPPADLPEDCDFVDGIVTMLANRDPPTSKASRCTSTAPTRSMEKRVFVDADGELLIMPQSGDAAHLHRAWPDGGRAGLGRDHPARDQVPGRGCDGEARGYVAENHGLPLRLPELGPIGANGLANPRDFETPVGRVRGPGRADRGRPEISSAACGRRRSIIRRSMSSPGTAILRPAAMIWRGSTRSARSASTIPTRRSSPS